MLVWIAGRKTVGSIGKVMVEQSITNVVNTCRSQGLA